MGLVDENVKYARAVAKLWGMVDKDPDGCWTIATNFSGKYAQIMVRGYRTYAHRFAYELTYGPIPEGMDLDHRCHNEAAALGTCGGGNDCPHHKCVRPDHLIPKARRDNLADSPLTQAAINGTKTHCVRGHEFTEENTLMRKGGWRNCRTCNRMGKEGRAEWDSSHD